MWKKNNLENSMPRLVSANPDRANRELIRSVLPKGSSLFPERRKASGGFFGQSLPGGTAPLTQSGGGGSAMYHTVRPYDPWIECFIEGTQVNLADGTFKEIENIRPGDKVIDKNGSIATVEKQWCSGIPEEVVEIVSMSGLKWYSTTYHNWPVFAWARECNCGCGTPVPPGKVYAPDHYKNSMSQVVYVRGGTNRLYSARQGIPEGYDPIKKLKADEIRKGDFLLMPRKFDEISTTITEEEARLLGYYVSEGSISCDRYGSLYSLTLTFGMHEETTLAEDSIKILSNLGIPAFKAVYPEKGVCSVQTRNGRGEFTEKVKILLEWLIESGGQLSYNKKLSPVVMWWPLHLKLSFITGLFRGDGGHYWETSVKEGYSGHTFHIQYGTSSKILSKQVQLILAQLGHPGIISTNKAKTRQMKGKSVNCREFYTVRVPLPGALDLARVVWPNSEETEKHKIKKVMKPSCMVDDNYVYFPVKKVSIVKNNKPVYNLTVSGDHSYLVWNIATYNSIDKQFYPQDRITASRYWRLFYKHDPIVGTAIDMYAEMVVSTFDLIVEDDSSQEIKDTLEYMCDSVDIIDKLKSMIREYLVIGETFPHCFFNEDSNVWDYICLHNPDYMDVKDIVLANMDPILNYIPDQETKSLLSDGSPESREFRKRLPAEFVSKVLAGQPIRMNPVNCTFIPRKLHPYQSRGCSIISRMFRILMVEDAVYNSTIATYRRNASPLKVCKLGSEASNWIPNPSQEAKVMDMLTKAENDSQAWLIYNYGINFEAFGTADRAITINKEQQSIDGIKLTALGLSKGFISGDANYASSKAGLQVFLRRLLSLRQFIESVWLYPKFFRPICEINGWSKATTSEISHRYRIKRTAQELSEQKLLIVPKVQWTNRLDPSLDSEVLNALNTLKTAFNFKVSKDTLSAYSGLKWQEEEKKSAYEFKKAKEIAETLLGKTLNEQYQQQGAPKPAAPPGSAGSGAKPPSAGGGKGSSPVGGQQSAPPGSAGEKDSFGAAPGDGVLNTPPAQPSSASGLNLS